MLIAAVEVEQNLAEVVQPCAKDALRFASMLFDFDGTLLNHPLSHLMCPAECQG